MEMQEASSGYLEVQWVSRGGGARQAVGIWRPGAITLMIIHSRFHSKYRYPLHKLYINSSTVGTGGGGGGEGGEK